MEKDAGKRGICLSNCLGLEARGLPGSGQSDAPVTETAPGNPGIRDSDGGFLALPEDHRTQIENTTLLNPGGIETDGSPNWGAARSLSPAAWHYTEKAAPFGAAFSSFLLI